MSPVHTYIFIIQSYLGITVCWAVLMRNAFDVNTFPFILVSLIKYVTLYITMLNIVTK